MTESVASTREFEGLQIPAAGTYLLDAAHKRVGFVVEHLMVSKVRGNFSEADATITIAEDPLQSSVTATIKTASVAHRPGRPRQPPAHRRLLRGREVPDDGVPQHRHQVARRHRVRARPAS